MKTAPITPWALVHQRWKWPLLLWPYLAVACLWYWGKISPVPLVYSVPKLAHLSFLETHWAYAYLHIFAIVPVFILSFDRKVHYFKSWPYLFPALLIVGIQFIVWDVYKTLAGVWGFNVQYITGTKLWHLPWEEWLFFLSVPFASIFIYECLNAYFPGDPFKKWDRVITPGLIAGCFISAFWNLEKAYTSTTFILTGGFLLYHYLFLLNTYRTRFYRAFLVILIPFLLVDGILTGGFTQEPIVVYNPAEFMGLRIVSVPLEDAVYGFLHLFGVCYWMEWWRKR